MADTVPDQPAAFDPATFSIHPDDFENDVASQEFRELPADQRAQIVERGLAGVARHVAEHGGWDKETWQAFGNMADQARAVSAPSLGETVGADVKAVPGMAGGLAQLSATLPAAAADYVLSKMLPGGHMYGYQAGDLADQWGKAFNANVNGAGAAGNEFAAHAVDAYQVPTVDEYGNVLPGAQPTAPPKLSPLRQRLGALKTSIDQGDLPLDNPQNVNAWLAQQDAALAPERAAWYARVQGRAEPTVTEDAHAWANGLHDPQNAALLAHYVQTRNPAAWSALVNRMEMTPDRAAAEDTKQGVRDSMAGSVMKAMGADPENLVQAAHPLNLAMFALPVLRGAGAVAKAIPWSEVGMNTLKSIPEMGAFGAENTIEQNPGASLGDIAAGAGHMAVTGGLFAGALGAGGKIAGDAARGKVKPGDVPPPAPTDGGLVNVPPQPPVMPDAVVPPAVGSEGATDADFAQMDTALRPPAVEEPPVNSPASEAASSPAAGEVSAAAPAAAPEPAAPPPAPEAAGPGEVGNGEVSQIRAIGDQVAAQLEARKAARSAPSAFDFDFIPADDPEFDGDGYYSTAWQAPHPEDAYLEKFVPTDSIYPARDGGFYVGESPVKFHTLDEAKAAVRAEVKEYLENNHGTFGNNLDGQQAAKQVFGRTRDLFKPFGGEWGGTKWGSWYYDTVDADGDPIKLSIRDHEATRKDMGLPDKSWEVSKNWDPTEVADALAKAHEWLSKELPDKVELPDNSTGIRNTRIKRNLESGYLNAGGFADLVNHAADAIGRGVRDFATWAGQAITEFGKGILPYLRNAWNKAFGPRAWKFGDSSGTFTGRSEQGFAGVGADRIAAAREAATMPNNPESASGARPLKAEYGGDPADYTAFTVPDMQDRAKRISEAIGSLPDLARLLSSEQGVRALGLDPALHAFVQADALRQAAHEVSRAGNDVDRIRATQTLRTLKRLVDAQGTETGQAMAGRRYALTELRDELPGMMVDDAIEKQQTAVIDPNVPVDKTTKAVADTAHAAGEAATRSLGEAMHNDADFEQRLTPILQRLQQTTPADVGRAVRSLIDGKADFRGQIIDEAARAVKAKFDAQGKPPAEIGALREVVNNLKRILVSKVPTLPKLKDTASFAKRVARVFLDYQNEKNLFHQAWNEALQRVPELRDMVPKDPALWFNGKDTTKLFTDAIAHLQGGETARLRDVLLNPERMGQGVMKFLNDQAIQGGMNPENLRFARDQMQRAWHDFVYTLQEKAANEAAVRLGATRDRLVAGGSPLAKLINQLRGKITGGLDWKDIFKSTADQQRQWELDTYTRLRQHQALAGLDHGEVVKLTREFSKVWQQERRNVFQAELQRTLAKVDGIKPAAVPKVTKSAPRLLQLINLGAFDASAFRDAVAREWGIKDLSHPEAQRLKALANQMQAAPEGLPRRKFAVQFMQGLQDLTKLSKLQILDSWWTSAVISGWRTHADILLSAANGIEDVGLGSLITAFRTGNLDVATRAIGKVLGNLPTALSEALHHITTGDKTMMRAYDVHTKKALEDGQHNLGSAGRQLLAKGGLWKAPGAFIELIGRMHTAWDHINSSSTYEGAKMMALARHPELYEAALKRDAGDRTAARARARQELTGGVEPRNQTERLQENARVKEILDEPLPLEVIAQAREIGLDTSLQNNPDGLGHAVVWLAKQPSALLDRGVAAIEAHGRTDFASRAVLGALRRASTVSRILTGTKFARIVGNIVNRNFSYVPGLGLARLAEKGMVGAKADILLAHQLVGTAVGLGLYSLLANRKTDDMGIEGGWSGLTPAQRSQLYAEGKQPNSVWYRDANGRIVTASYNNWGAATMLGIVGAMNDRRRYFKDKSTLNLLINGVCNGAFALTDKAQLQGLQQLFGADSAYSNSDPGQSLAKRINKWASTTVGGLIPRIAKDVDYMVVPQLHDTSQWWAQWAQQVPVARELSSGKRVDIFGADINLDRGPLSRAVQFGTTDPTYRTLGQLNARDVWLPDPSTGVRVVPSDGGARRPMTPQEKDRYQRQVGAAYKTYIQNRGADLLAMPPDEARKTITHETSWMRSQAARQAVSR